MTGSVPDILARIVEHKRTELAAAIVTRGELEELARESIPLRRDFRGALAARRPALIAEFKKASPSRGAIGPDRDPGEVARAYAAGGAAALSVLTDERFFGGSLDDLASARGAVSLPVLRKDFTLSEWHIAEAAAYSADAVLLIAAVLSTKRLRELREYAARFGLAALVEVHDEHELESAVESGAAIIGVNNRNLHTFEVTIQTSLALAPRIPDGVLRVSESGIRTREDVRRLMDTGYHALLVGESLMRAPDAASALRELLA